MVDPIAIAKTILKVGLKIKKIVDEVKAFKQYAERLQFKIAHMMPPLESIADMENQREALAAAQKSEPEMKAFTMSLSEMLSLVEDIKVFIEGFKGMNSLQQAIKKNKIKGEFETFDYKLDTRQQSIHMGVLVEFKKEADAGRKQDSVKILVRHVKKASTSHGSSTADGKSKSKLKDDIPTIASDDLEVIEELGEGGFGKVLLAKYKEGERVAVKVFDVGNNRSVLKEVAMMRQAIFCPYVVRLRGIVDEPGTQGIVMDYYEYGSLTSFLPYLECDCWPRRIRMLCDIASGINYLHTDLMDPLVHSDIKLSNMFVDHGFAVKIGDFGLASSGTTTTKSISQASVIGTYSHMAPELWAGIAGDAEPSLDIYGFGISIYEFITGKKPWPPTVKPDWISGLVLSGKRPNLKFIKPDTPTEVVAMMRKCWQTDPKFRPTSTEILRTFSMLYKSHYEAELLEADRVIRRKIKGEQDYTAPSEIRLRGPAAVEAYQKALEGGSQEIRSVRVMLVGQERVGKTSLVKAFMGDIFKDDEGITDGVDTSNICAVPYSDLTDWKSLSHRETEECIQELDERRNYGLLSATEHELDKVTTKESWEELSWASSSSILSSIEPLTIGSSTPTPTQASDRNKVTKQETPRAKKSQDPIIPKEEQQAKKSQDSEIPKEVSEAKKPPDELEITFWDFAGQNLYYTTHQVFFNRRAIFALVFDMSKNLEDKCVVSDFSISSPEKTRRFDDFTGEDFFRFWLQSIYTYAVMQDDDDAGADNTERYPPILIVGTHRRDPHAIGADLAKKKIFHIIKDKPYERYVRRKFHFLENKPEAQQQSSDDEAMDSLKDDIAQVAMNAPHIKEKYPINWINFHKAVLEEVAKGHPYMNYHEVKALAAEQQITDESQITTMLNLYHDIGIIIWYGDHGHSLKNTVILDPQWLIDVFKAVITVKSDEEQNVGEKESDDAGDSVHQQSVEYCVPACLQPVEKSEDENIMDGTFYVDFYKFLPDGFFHRVLVHFARWSSAHTGEPFDLFYRKCESVVGCKDKNGLHTHECSLSMIPSGVESDCVCIKVVVKRVAEYGKESASTHPDQKVCTEVFEFISKTLQVLRDKWANGIKYEMSVCCIACKDAGRRKLHLIPVEKCRGSQPYICQRGKRKVGIPADKLYWEAMTGSPSSSDKQSESADQNKQATVIDSKISEADIRLVARKVGLARGDLETLYIELGMTVAEIDIGKQAAPNAHDFTLEAFYVLTRWKSRLSKEATRRKILDALKESLLNDARQQLIDIWESTS